MGIFYTSAQPVLPTIKDAIRSALATNPGTLVNLENEAANRTVSVAQSTTPKFNPWRFIGAVIISGLLLYGAIWTGQHNLQDISKDLMNSFSAFSGIVLGLLGGEAQKSASG